MNLPLAQRHCALAIVAALDDNRKDCHRLIVEAAKEATGLPPMASEREPRWNMPKLIHWLCIVTDKLQPVYGRQVAPMIEIQSILSLCAELAWPGPEGA